MPYPGQASHSCSTGDAIVVNSLGKSYGATVVLSDVGFRVKEGEILAVLGPNGAGKTTLTEILEGYRRRDRGEVSVLGWDPQLRPRELRERLGIVLQEDSLEPLLTVAEIFYLYHGFYRRSRLPGQVIDTVGLSGKEDARIATLSGGERRRIDLGLALMGDPDLLILDEATAGFDPEARETAAEILRECSARGKTIVLTSHDLEEVEALADRLIIINGGRILVEGELADLRAKATSEAVIRFRRPRGFQANELPDRVRSRIRVAGEYLEMRDADPTTALSSLTAWAMGLGIRLEELGVNWPSLRDLYIDVTATARGQRDAR